MSGYVYILSPKSDSDITKLGKAASVKDRFKAFNKIGYCGFDDWEVIHEIELDDDGCAREFEKLIKKELKSVGLSRGKVPHLSPAKNDYKSGVESYNANFERVLGIIEQLEVPRNAKILELEKRVEELELQLSKFI